MTGACVSRLTDLIARAKAKDAQLGADLNWRFAAMVGESVVEGRMDTRHASPLPVATFRGLPS
jgi:hypothetical protein